MTTCQVRLRIGKSERPALLCPSLPSRLGIEGSGGGALPMRLLDRRQIASSSAVVA